MYYKNPFTGLTICESNLGYDYVQVEALFVYLRSQSPKKHINFTVPG